MPVGVVPSPSRRFEERPFCPRAPCTGRRRRPSTRRAPPRSERRVRRSRDLRLDGDQLLRRRRRLEAVRQVLRAGGGRRGDEQGQSEHGPRVRWTDADRARDARAAAIGLSCCQQLSGRSRVRRDDRAGAVVGAPLLVPGRVPGRAGAAAHGHVSYWDFAGTRQTGAIVVARGRAEAILTVFRKLWTARFPIKRLRPVSEYRGSDDASMEADNTSGFNCRFVGGTTRWSMHAYGEAIDVNPVENPYVAARPSRRRPARLSRPQPLPAGDGRDGRSPRQGVRVGRLEVGRLVRRLPALLDDGPLGQQLLEALGVVERADHGEVEAGRRSPARRAGRPRR